MQVIRSVSIGPDMLKAMRYSLKQKVKFNIGTRNHPEEVFRDIVQIKEISTREHEIFIETPEGQYCSWKKIVDMPIVIEYVTEFGESSL